MSKRREKVGIVSVARCHRGDFQVNKSNPFYLAS